MKEASCGAVGICLEAFDTGVSKCKGCRRHEGPLWLQVYVACYYGCIMYGDAMYSITLLQVWSVYSCAPATKLASSWVPGQAGAIAVLLS